MIKKMCIAAVLTALMIHSVPSQSAALIEARQVGSDVVIEISGSFNLAGLALIASGPGAGEGYTSGSIEGINAIAVGVEDFYRLYSVDTDIQFSTGAIHHATSSTGRHFEIRVHSTGATLNLPSNYVSGSEVSSSSTWANNTLENMGLVPGTYVVDWGTDTLTIEIEGTVTTETFSVGGTVSGLSGAGLALQNNGADTLDVANDGPFTFATELDDSSDYEVTVSAQPAGQTCQVSNGSGTIDGADVVDVAVTCEDDPVPTYTVGGTVSGLSGSLTLTNNGADALVIDANGDFTFATPLADDSDYAVAVSVQPDGQTCAVANGGGTVSGANVTNVAVNCEDDPVPTYTVGGTVSGLDGTVTLTNNGADALVVSANGGFTFATALEDNSAYAVAVSVQPAGQTCSVSNGEGTVSAADVEDVVVDCEDNLPPPVPREPIAVPVGSNWALMLLILSLMWFGGLMLRRAR